MRDRGHWLGVSRDGAGKGEGQFLEVLSFNEERKEGDEVFLCVLVVCALFLE